MSLPEINHFGLSMLGEEHPASPFPPHERRWRFLDGRGSAQVVWASRLYGPLSLPGHTMWTLGADTADAGGLRGMLSYDTGGTPVGVVSYPDDTICLTVVTDNRAASGAEILGQIRAFSMSRVSGNRTFGTTRAAAVVTSGVLTHPTYTPDCSVIYELTPCSGGSSLYTQTDLSANLGSVVVVSSLCYSVDIYRGDRDKIVGSIAGVTVSTTFPTCDDCTTVWALVRCSDGVITLTSTDLRAYEGRVVQKSGDANCYFVTRLSGTPGAAVTITADFDDCDNITCNPPTVPCDQCCLTTLGSVSDFTLECYCRRYSDATLTIQDCDACCKAGCTGFNTSLGESQAAGCGTYSVEPLGSCSSSCCNGGLFSGNDLNCCKYRMTRTSL